jgi:hypothetical protein
MKRDDILAYLSKQNIKLYFEYSPFDESTLDIAQEDFKEFFLEELVGYVTMSCGHPISGNFIATRKNDNIILESDPMIEVDWSYTMITGGADGLFIGDTDFLKELEGLIYDTYVSKDCTDWYYTLSLEQVNSKFSIDLNLFENDVEMGLGSELPEELRDFIVESVARTGGDDAYECEVFLTNSGEDNNFVERYKEIIEL